MPRWTLQIGAMAWAALGALIAVASLASVNDDARLLVGGLTIGGPLAAAVASYALAGHRDRVAGVLLLVSVATPTYFFWIVNLPALVLGLALLVACRGSARVGHGARISA
jgi:hypothetical protein